MSKPDTGSVKEALLAADVEIYRTTDAEIQIAERVRLHIMDSGVRVDLASAPKVTFTARSQRSDFPNADPSDLFERVRSQVGKAAQDRSYLETDARSVSINDPVNEERVLDVWHEITFSKDVPTVTELVQEVQWALTVDKVVSGNSES